MLLSCRLKQKIILLLIVGLSVSSSVRADQSYSDGVAAFIKSDYQRAQSSWLKSAKNGNAKSMFNLGLLHEQAKIANAQSSKAQEWYRLAGNAGYYAADYHLALLLLKKDRQSKQGKELLQRAADNGFALAVERVGTRVKAGADNGSSSKTVKKPTQQNIKASSDYLTEPWIKSKRAKSWTIQMLAFNEEKNVKKFIDDHQLKTKAAYFKEKTKKGVFYKLVYGVYKTKVQADFARQNLPESLKKHGPWLRSIESVHKVIKWN